MRTSALFGAKPIGFFEIYGVSARTEGRGLMHFEHIPALAEDLCSSLPRKRPVFPKVATILIKILLAV